jgi:hypothetical protein
LEDAEKPTGTCAVLVTGQQRLVEMTFCNIQNINSRHQVTSGQFVCCQRLQSGPHSPS